MVRGRGSDSSYSAPPRPRGPCVLVLHGGWQPGRRRSSWPSMVSAGRAPLHRLVAEHTRARRMSKRTPYATSHHAAKHATCSHVQPHATTFSHARHPLGVAADHRREAGEVIAARRRLLLERHHKVLTQVVLAAVDAQRRPLRIAHHKVTCTRQREQHKLTITAARAAQANHHGSESSTN
jgi:hypothetical protein